MRKKYLIIMLILMIVSIAGCNTDVEITTTDDSSENTADKNVSNIDTSNSSTLALNKPTIILNETVPNQSLQENTIYFTDEVNISIQFSSDIDEEYSNKKIRFDASYVNTSKMEWENPQRLNLVLKSNDVPEIFALIIEKGLKNNQGRVLKEDFMITFQKISTTIAKVKLIADDGVYEPSAFYYLTNTPKVFEISFSNPVNKESVENVLKDDLNDKADIKYEWKDDTLLYITVDNFEKGKYAFYLIDAYDESGRLIGYKTPILFAFYINSQSRIYSLDLGTKELKELDVKFPKDILWDDPYFAINDKIIGFTTTDYTISLSFERKKIYYDIEKDRIYKLKNENEEDYVDLNEVLADGDFNIVENKLYNSDGESIEITYDGSIQEGIDKIYKEQGKVIFYYPSSFDYSAHIGIKGIDLSIYDNKKDEIKKIQLDIQSLSYEEGPVPSKYILLNDGKTIIIEGLELDTDAFSSYRTDFNLYKLDVETGELEQLLENAHSPSFVDSNKFLLIDSNGQAKIADIEGNILEELPIIQFDGYLEVSKQSDNFLYCRDLRCNDGNIIGANEDYIFIYNINSKEVSKIQNNENLYLIGIGKSKVYLSNN